MQIHYEKSDETLLQKNFIHEFTGVVILNNDGAPVKSNMDAKQTELYANAMVKEQHSCDP